LCWILQGRKSVRIGERTWVYDPFHYLVLNRKTSFRAEVLQAYPERPFLSLVLRIEPTLVREVLAEMSERAMSDARDVGAEESPAFVSATDAPTAGALARFLEALGRESDRRVLAPMFLREIVYRVLQAGERSRLREAVEADNPCDAMALVACYIRQNLAKPLTVGEIAAQAGMSTSSLSTMFKELTGMAPYRFVKEARLDRARSMLATKDAAVGDVARSVGYTSLSHFSNDFHRRFGLSPSSFAHAERLAGSAEVEDE
jgi:AraC-like DNA-binding protein